MAALAVAGCATVEAPSVTVSPIGWRLVDETFSKYSFAAPSGEIATIAIGFTMGDRASDVCVGMGHTALRDDPAQTAEIDAWLRSRTIRVDGRVLIPDLGFAPIHLSDAIHGRPAGCVRVVNAPPSLQFEIGGP